MIEFRGDPDMYLKVHQDGFEIGTIFADQSPPTLEVKEFDVVFGTLDLTASDLRQIADKLDELNGANCGRQEPK